MIKTGEMGESSELKKNPMYMICKKNNKYAFKFFLNLIFHGYSFMINDEKKKYHKYKFGIKWLVFFSK